MIEVLVKHDAMYRQANEQSLFDINRKQTGLPTSSGTVTPLIVAIIYPETGKHAGIIRALLKGGAELSVTGANQQNAFHHAVSAGRADVLEALLKHHPNSSLIHARCDAGSTPLSIARNQRRDDLLRLLADYCQQHEATLNADPI